MSEPKIIGYRLEPVTAIFFGGMQVSTPSSCPLSRRMIRGCGGRRDILHPSVVDIVLNDRLFQELARVRLLELEKEKERISDD